MDLDDLRAAIRAAGHDPDVLLDAYRRTTGRDDAPGFADFLVNTLQIRSEVVARFAAGTPIPRAHDAGQLAWSMVAPGEAAGPTASLGPAPTSAGWDAAARRAVVEAAPAFAALGPDARAALADAADALAVPARGHLFRIGDRAAGLFFVAAGRLTIAAAGANSMKELGPGVVIGAHAYQNAGERTADVRAVDDAVVLVLGDEARRALVAAWPTAATWFGGLARERFAGLDDVLRQVFGALDDRILDRLCALMDPVHLAGGATLFRHGAPGDAMFVLLHGSLAVRVPGDGGDRVVRRLVRGDPVGERALLTGEPRAATIVALRDCELLRLAAGDFEAVLREQAGAMVPFIRMLAGRMFAAAPREIERRSNTVALVPLNPGVPAAALARTLGAALDDAGAVIDAARFDAAHGAHASTTPAHHPNARAFTAWMSELEDRHTLVLYVGDAADSEWTRRCLRAADRVLLIGDATASPAAGAVDEAIARSGHGTVDLVLLHPADAGLPRGTRAWLDARPFVGRHHHWRRDHPGDLARLVRRLTGRTVGFVLGGGGAKGFAHLGVIRALTEAGVPIDAVAGTSMGAGMGAGVALQLPLDEIADGIRRVFVDTRLNRAFTVPLVSLLSTNKLDPMLDVVGYGRDIEDAWLPFLAVATNLTRSRLEVLDRGPIAFAARASSSLPGIFPPAVRDGELFVDGGLLDNLPLAPLRARTTGPLIAIDVGTKSDVKVDPALTRLPSGFELLWRRINPLAQRIRTPGIAEVLYQSLVCTSAGQVAQALRDADVALRPPVDRFGLMKFEASDAIIAVGYEYAKTQLDRVLTAVKPSLAPPRPPP